MKLLDHIIIGNFLADKESYYSFREAQTHRSDGRADIIPPPSLIPTARLGDGTRIGPYAVIEGPAEIGDACVIEAHATLTGTVRLGRGVRVGHGSVIGGWPQDFAFDPATESGVEVGDGSADPRALHDSPGHGRRER